MTLRRFRLLFACSAIFAALFFSASSSQAQIEMGGGRIDVVFESNDTGIPQTLILDWIKKSARAVTSYFGRYPVPRVVIRVNSIDGDRIESGQTFGTREGGLIKIAVGRETTPAHFARDWMMTHEMVHLAFPSVPERNHWLEEGIATYVEPIARVQAGLLSAKQAWAEIVRDLPQGLPEAGDRGLDFTHTWGRTYWGGALFCLQADVEIRRRTNNAKGLVDALRGILEAGGNISEDWDVAHALQTGDRATGVPVLQELYARMSASPGTVDLPGVWQKLGINARGRSADLNNGAPWADTRRAIMANE